MKLANKGRSLPGKPLPSLPLLWVRSSLLMNFDWSQGRSG